MKVHFRVIGTHPTNLMVQVKMDFHCLLQRYVQQIYSTNVETVFPIALHYGPGVMRISSTTDCAAVGGSCSASADCDLSNNVFVGSCDDTSFGCCVSKDDVCAARNGECVSEADCTAKSGYRATRMACSDGVCCVPRRSSPPNGGNGTGPGSRNEG